MHRSNSLDRFARNLVAFRENEDENTLVIPEDLSTLSDDELTALAEQASQAFDALYGDGAGLAPDVVDALAEITEGIETITAEVSKRAQAQEERDQRAADLAARVRPADQSSTQPPEEEEEAPAEGEEEEEAPAEGEEEEPPGGASQTTQAAADQVVASAQRRTPIRVNLPAVGARRNGIRPSQATGMRDIVLAAGDGTGFQPNQGVDWAQVGQIVDRRLAGYNPSAYEAAAQHNRHIRQQFGVVTIHKPFPDDLVLRTSDPQAVDEVLAKAIDQSRLPQGSLLAAGGWCAPSQVLYDLLELESRDGLFSLPEVGISRGGISYTTGPDFATLYNGAPGFHYTEAQDIAGQYVQGGATNEVQSIATTGTPTGGTFQLAFNGIPTGPIPFNATAAQIRAALNSVIGAGNITSVGGGPLPTAATLTYGGAYAGIDVPLLTLYSNGLTGGTTPTVTISQTTAGSVAANTVGAKPCYDIPCPSFTEVRLDVDGLCIKAGLLEVRGYPEMLARVTRGVLIAHDHRLSGRALRAIENGSTPVNMPVPQQGTTAALLTSIELQVEHYRYIHRLTRATTLEAIFPFWIKGAIRSDLSRRNGVDMINVSDSMINGWFSDRGVSAQFVYNWQDIGGTSDQFTMWPAAVKFLLYAAGTWIRGTSDIITLDTIYDSVLLGTNDFVALFTEEGWLVAKRGFDSRVVTVPVFSDGSTGSQVDYDSDGRITAGSTAGITA